MRRRFLFLVMFALLLAGGARAAQPGDELLPNGGFEQKAPAGDRPAAWRVDAAVQWAGDGRNRWVVEEARGTPGSLSVAAKVPLEESYWKIRVSCRVRATDVRQGAESWHNARVAMQFQGKDYKQVGAWPNVMFWTGSTDGWVTASRDYLVPDGAAFLDISFSLFSTTGKVEWDDVSVKLLKTDPVMEDATLPAGVAARWDLARAYREETPTRGRVCINGLWRFHPADLQSTALPAPGTGWGYLKVPGTWVPGRSGQNHIGPDIWETTLDLGKTDAAWYQRAIDVPASWKGRRIFVNIDNPKQTARVLVDGKPAGEIGWPGGRVDVTSLVLPGKTSTLSVFVLGLPLQTEQLVVARPDLIEKARVDVKFKGLGGDCFLESEPAGARIADIFVQPSVQRSALGVRCELDSVPAGGKVRLQATVMRGGKTVKSFTSEPFAPARAKTFSGAWADPLLWDIDKPNLYTLSVRLIDAAGKTLDQSTPVTFGFREFWIQGKDLYLNGKRIHFRALVLANADGNFGTASYGMTRRSMSRARALGFNFAIQSNYDYEPQSFAYMDDVLKAGDEVGFPLSYTIRHIKEFFARFDDPAQRADWERVVEYEMRRVRNHPSVLMWAMNHNFTGYGDDQNPARLDAAQDPDVREDRSLSRRREMALLAESFVRKHDPTRPAYHHESGNLGRFTTLNIYLNWTPLQERIEWLSRWASHGAKPLVFVEFGLPHVASFGNFRTGPFVWRNNVSSEPMAAEFSAIYSGDSAYALSPEELGQIDVIERVYARREPFHISDVLGAYWQGRFEHNFIDQMTLHTRSTWPAYRTWGISSLLPWDQDQLYRPLPGRGRDPEPLATDWAHLQRPGPAPDFYYPNGNWTMTPNLEANFVPTSLGRMFHRVNRERLAYLAGPARRFTAQDHNFTAGERIEKQAILVNDGRAPARFQWSWQASVGGKVVGTGRGTAVVPPGDHVKAPFSFPAPAAATDRRGTITLRASLSGDPASASDEALQDHFDFNVLPAPAPLALPGGIAVYDPRGQTLKLLRDLKVPVQEVKEPVPPAGARLLIVGREAVTLDGPGIDMARVLGAGANVLFFEQSEAVLQRRWGFRTASPGTRRVWMRDPSHPVNQGLSDDLLRDWRGSSSLLAPYPTFTGKATQYRHEDWLGFNNTRTWQWGNYGTVASVVLEKPQRGNFSSTLDCEFDQQYTPLLEWRTPQGRALFSQIDFTGRDAADPAARRLLGNLLAYAASAPRPALADASIQAGSAARAWLADIGLALESDKSYPAECAVIAPGFDPASARAAVAQMKTVVCIGLTGEQLSAILPFAVRTAPRPVTHTLIGRPTSGVLQGLGNTDFHWRGRITIDAITEAPRELQTLPTGVLATGEVGGKRYVLIQYAPTLFDETQKPYLRLSRRRALISIGRILTNCGVALAAPTAERLRASAPVDVDLTGAWRFRKDDGKLDPATVAAAGYDDSGWLTLQTPGLWEGQNESLKDYDGVGWYRKSFTLTADQIGGSELTLNLGAIDDEDATYVNGQPVGHIDRTTNPDNYWEAPRRYRLPAGLLRAGQNVVTVKVTDLKAGGGIARGPLGITQPGRWLGSYYLDIPNSLDDPYRYNRW